MKMIGMSNRFIIKAQAKTIDAERKLLSAINTYENAKDVMIVNREDDGLYTLRIETYRPETTYGLRMRIAKRLEFMN